MNLAVPCLRTWLLAISTTSFSLTIAPDAAAQTRPYNPMRPLEHQASPVPAGTTPRQLTPDEGMATGPVQPTSSRNQSQWRSARRAGTPMPGSIVSQSAQPLPPPASHGGAPESIIVPAPGETAMPGETHWDDGSV